MKTTTVRVSRFLDNKFKPFFDGASLLILRLSFGGTIFFAHGWPKLMNFSALASQFPDPLGVGSAVSLALVLFAEVLCALMLALGFATRVVAIPLIIMMIVAGLVHHAEDAFAQKEMALLYGAVFVVLALRGGGTASLDSLVFPKTS